MDSVVRGVSVYVILLLIFRVAGRRTLAELTNFDFVLLLIIGEATQQALLGEDFSITNAVLVVMALVMTDVVLSVVKFRWPAVETWIDGRPMVILRDGRPLLDRMRRARVDEHDILHAARASQGLERLDQIKYAVLETSGGISIVPKEQQAAGSSRTDAV